MTIICTAQWHDTKFQSDQLDMLTLLTVIIIIMMVIGISIIQYVEPILGETYLNWVMHINFVSVLHYFITA